MTKKGNPQNLHPASSVGLHSSLAKQSKTKAKQSEAKWYHFSMVPWYYPWVSTVPFVENHFEKKRYWKSIFGKPIVGRMCWSIFLLAELCLSSFWGQFNLLSFWLSNESFLPVTAWFGQLATRKNQGKLKVTLIFNLCFICFT